MRTVSVGLQLATDAFQAGSRVATKTVTALGQTIEGVAKKGSTAFTKLGTGLDKVADAKPHLDTVAGALGVIGVTATAAAGVAIKSFADFDKSMSQVKAATHETSSNMGLLREAALQAGKDTAFSATEAAGAIENLSKAGVSTKEILGGGLTGALSLAAAGEMEVADAAETAATAMTQFKLSGKDVPHIADLLAAGAGKAQGDVSDLAMALKQSGLVASQFGLSIEDTTGTLSAFASAGLIGSDAGTSFKTMLIALANPAEKTKEKMQELGIAAYDANGNFVGITNLAQQLKEKLGPLDQATRDQALAQIFGNDAIRAANVLYQEGGAGIDAWIGKVNDAGYAAQTAATLQDNLAGDIEQLGGSLETAFIQAGSGANDFARSAVQSTQAVVDAFADLPPAAQNAVLMGTVVLGATSLVSAGAIKGVTALAEFKTALTALGVAGRTAVLGMGALGVALGLGAFIVGRFAREQAEAKQRVEELTATLDQQTGAVTKGSREWATAQLRGKGLLDLAEDLKINLEDLTSAYLGDEKAIKRVNAQLAAAETANEALTGTLTGQGDAIDRVLGKTDTFSQAWAKAGGTTLATTEQVNRFKAALEEGGVALDKSQKEIRQNAEAGGENADTQGELADAVKLSTEAMEGNAEEASAAADALAAMDERAKALKESLELLSGTMSEREMQANYEEAIDGINTRLQEYRDLVKDGDAATKGMANAFDISTQAGRDNDEAMRGLWERTADYATEALRVEGNQGKANKILREGRAELVQMATKFLGSKEKAEDYVTTVLGIPKNVATNVSAPGLKPTRDTAEDYKIIMGAIKPNKQVNWKAPGLSAALTNTRALARAAQNAEGSYYLNYYITTTRRNKHEAQSNLFAGGGWVNGPGGPTDDMVPINASAGEFVVSAADAARNATVLEAINSGITIGEPGFDLGALKARTATHGLPPPVQTVGTSAAPAPVFTASGSGSGADLAAALRAAGVGGGLNLNVTTVPVNVPQLVREVVREMQFAGYLPTAT